MQDKTLEVQPRNATNRWVAIADTRLIIFPSTDRPGPICVALRESGDRCAQPVWSGEPLLPTEVAVPARGMIDAFDPGDRLASRLLAQRCERHIDDTGPNALTPEWVDLDPDDHAELLEEHYCIWTSDGLRFRVDEGDSPMPHLDVTAAMFTTPNVNRTIPRPLASFGDPSAKPTALYRYFDAADVLLYIGITEILHRRASAHFAYSSWMDFAIRSTIERFPNRSSGENAEAAAIKAELPLFNSQHADLEIVTPMLVAYLVDHERYDMLAPVLSRG